MTANEVYTLYLVRGLPGSGKSTLARRLKGEYWAEYYEADKYFVGKDGVYTFDGSKISCAHEWNQREVENGMRDDEFHTIIVANTFSQRWEMQPYRDLAERYGYTVVEVTVESGLTDSELAARNVHNCPESVIAKMRARWEK